MLSELRTLEQEPHLARKRPAGCSRQLRVQRGGCGAGPRGEENTVQALFTPLGVPWAVRRSAESGIHTSSCWGLPHFFRVVLIGVTREQAGAEGVFLLLPFSVPPDAHYRQNLTGASWEGSTVACRIWSSPKQSVGLRQQIHNQHEWLGNLPKWDGKDYHRQRETWRPEYCHRLLLLHNKLAMKCYFISQIALMTWRKAWFNHSKFRRKRQRYWGNDDLCGEWRHGRSE